jgi:outer membrane protein TolC
MKRRVALCVALSVAGAFAATAQVQLPGMSATAPETNERGQGVSGVSALPAGPSNPFRGAAPRGERSATPMELSLAQAIRLGLERNLGPLLTSSGQRTARGERMIALGRLLPDIHAAVNESSQQLNLAAYGFKLSSDIPNVVGPFRLFDSRAYVSQSLFNLRQLYNKRASDRQLDAANFDDADARDTVVEVVTALYWEAAADASRIEAARAQVDTAEAAYQVAEDRRTAGLAPAIDVLRAQVELQNQRQRLIASQTAFEKAKLSIAEAIGIPGGQGLNLTDPLGFEPLQNAPDEAAIDQAFQSRSDYQSQAARVQAAELERKGVAQVRIPTVSLDGDYGVLGRSPASSHGTFSIKLGVNIPIYAGGAERGALIRAEAEEQRQRDLLAELRAHIGFEIRSALLDLNAAAQQVSVSRSALDLATQQVAQARDRLSAGVTDTLETVQAEEGQAAANDNYITSLYAYNLAKVQLARAMGGTERNLARWAGEGNKP